MGYRRYKAYLLFSILLIFFYNNCSRPGIYSNSKIEQASLRSSTLNPDATDLPDLPLTNAPIATPALDYFGANPDWPMDRNCMTNLAYDACLVWKNPIAHRYLLTSDASASIFLDANQQPSIMDRGTDLSSITTLGVHLSKWIVPAGSNQLKSDFIDVYASNGQTSSLGFLRTKPLNGQFKFIYQTDSNYNFSQTAAFYWINYARDFFKSRGAQYFAEKAMPGKPLIPIDAYSSAADVVNNGYFSANAAAAGNEKWGKIVLGKISNGTHSHELALSAEAYLHEMGHANLYYALGGPQNQTSFNDTNMGVVQTTNGSTALVCLTSNGCYRAINEGQADFHSHVLFEKQPYLLEQLLNLANGPNDRNAFLVGTKTAAEVYNSSAVRQISTNRLIGGEIHGLGAIYAAILFKIYTHKDGDKSRFLKVFSTHLTFLDSSSTFKSAKQDLLDADIVVPGKSLASIISAEFASKGL